VVRLPPRLRPLFPYLKPAYVSAAGAAAPVLQRVSRVRGGWLPTGVVATLDAAARSSGGRCVVARPAEVIARESIEGRPPGMPLADTGDGETVGRVAVAELPHGRVLGPHRAVITGNGDLVNEVSWYFGTRRPRQHPVFLNPFPAPPMQVSGRLGVLAARGDGNYYHFLMDVLTKIGVLEQAADVAPPDRWYVPAQTRFQRELLDLFDIAPDDRIDAAEHRHVQADVLVVPGAPAMTEKNPPWAVEFLRGKLLPHVDLSGPRQRIYVTRGPSSNNRSIVNERELLDVLDARGFAPVDPGQLSVKDQIRAFATASVIVAPHGAALANLIFASPGASVVELFPAGCLLPDYWRLASSVPGLRYRYVSSLGGPRHPTRAGTIVRDIEVDVAAVAATLNELDKQDHLAG
jgi:capsular polysaccharide biosynthesis protein